MNNENKMSRRQVVAGLGATLATAAIAPAFAATESKSRLHDDAAKISDPTKLYPKPPFKVSLSRGRDYKAKWTRYPIAVKPAIKAREG